MDTVIIGVDEAGRGPLAGPVSVGVVKVPMGFSITTEFPGVADSKKLKEGKREELYEKLLWYKDQGMVDFVVQFRSAAVIDEVGITEAVRDGVHSGIRQLVPDSGGVRVLLDGLLHAPTEYAQETIIKGDEKEPVISLASIAAKVERDRLMKELAKEFPLYGFDIHKGYGTKKHKEAVAQFGLCALHRKTFCG